MTYCMDWVTCASSAACMGIARHPYDRCLAHLQPDEAAVALDEITPGRLLDLRGTPINGPLLGRIIEATGGRPGRARLDRVTFTGDVRLSGVTFTGDVSLDGARFERLASFFGARFEGNVSLAGAGFARELSFHGVRVRGHLSLDRAVMSRDALFSQAVFGRGLSCERARFDGYATFDGAMLGDGASFRGARFGRTLSFRKVTGHAGFDTAHFAADAYLSATGRLSASRARADGTFDVAVASGRVDLRRTEVAGGATIRLTDSHADLEGAVLRGPASGDRARLVHADLAAPRRCGRPGAVRPRPVGVQVRRAGPPGRGPGQELHVRADPAGGAGEPALADAALVLPAQRAGRRAHDARLGRPRRREAPLAIRPRTSVRRRRIRPPGPIG